MEQWQDQLEKAIYQLNKEYSFYAHILQVMEIRFETSIPTAGVRLDPKNRALHMYVNPMWFGEKSEKERVAVLTHEVEHVARGHLLRFPYVKSKTKEQHTKENISMDISINSRIKNLPKGCMLAKNFKDLNGNVCKDDLQTEWYLDNIDWENSQGEGEGNGDHEWGDQGGELADATGDLIKRAMNKATMSYSSLPAHVKETLQLVDTIRSNLNFKELLSRAIKQSLRAPVRKSTWNRPNKRFGLYAKGNEDSKLPKLEQFVDTSGSISISELEISMGCVDSFLRYGAKTCNINLFHTSLYESLKYKIGFRPKLLEKIQSGGTCLREVLDKIKTIQPNLSIIYTDGYYSDLDIKDCEMPTVIFLISKNGDLNHPFSKRKWAITIEIV